MDKILRPIPILCLGISIVGAVLNNIPLMLLGILCLLAALGFGAARGAQKLRDEEVGESLSPVSRTMLRPIKRLYDELDQVVQDNRGSATVSVLGVEALTEAKRILQQSADSLAVRDKIVKALQGKYEADKGVASLETQIAGAKTDEERSALLSAQNARKLEAAHYADIESYLPKIDSGIRQAEAALAEIKARLAAGASGETAQDGRDEDLRESISHLKAVSMSYDEANDLLQGNVNS